MNGGAKCGPCRRRTVIQLRKGSSDTGYDVEGITPGEVSQSQKDTRWVTAPSGRPESSDSCRWEAGWRLPWAGDEECCAITASSW